MDLQTARYEDRITIVMGKLKTLYDTEDQPLLSEAYKPYIRHMLGGGLFLPWTFMSPKGKGLRKWLSVLDDKLQVCSGNLKEAKK